MTRFAGEVSGPTNGLRFSGVEKVRILVVEDSATQAESLRYILEQNGYEVFVAGNGREALKRIGGIEPAAVISDIIMPEMDGFRLCMEMKSDERLKSIPIILLTALSDPKDVLRGLECGADNFITKPYDEDYLLSKIRYVLTNAGKQSKSGAGIEILFQGEKYFIASERRQMLDLLLSSYETAVTKNRELKQSQEKLEALNERLERNMERFRLLSGTAGLLLATEDPQGIVNGLCRKVMEHLDCQVFFNYMVDETAGKLRLNACNGIPGDEVRKIEWLDFGVGVSGCVARDEERIVAEDISVTPDSRTDLVRSYGFQAYACHPLTIEGKLIGTLSFGTRTRPRFSPQDLDLMKTVTDQVAIALERMRLIEELRESKDALEARVRERTAELERRNRELENFTFAASHDLQEPLRKIQTFGDVLLLKHNNSLGEEGSDYLRRMRKTAAGMQDILHSLLQYSLLTSDPQPLALVDLSRIAREVISRFEVQIKGANASVVVEDLPEIQADAGQMSDLVANLLGNALKFRREGENLRVRIHSDFKGTDDLKWYEIYFEDNGIGFDEKYLDRIFVPFQRLNRRGEHEGVGMGLTICKKIVERHGGAITARSNPGKGSTFIVTLPGKKEPS